MRNIQGPFLVRDDRIDEPGLNYSTQNVVIAARRRTDASAAAGCACSRPQLPAIHSRGARLRGLFGSPLSGGLPEMRGDAQAVRHLEICEPCLLLLFLVSYVSIALAIPLRERPNLAIIASPGR